MNQFGQELKKIRNNSGLSQNEVGRVLGYKNGQLVSNWERGTEQTIPMEAMLPFCKLMKTPREQMVQLYTQYSNRKACKLLRVKKTR